MSVSEYYTYIVTWWDEGLSEDSALSVLLSELGDDENLLRFKNFTLKAIDFCMKEKIDVIIHISAFSKKASFILLCEKLKMDLMLTDFYRKDSDIIENTRVHKYNSGGFTELAFSFDYPITDEIIDKAAYFGDDLLKN